MTKQQLAPLLPGLLSGLLMLPQLQPPQPQFRAPRTLFQRALQHGQLPLQQLLRRDATAQPALLELDQLQPEGDVAGGVGEAAV